jgi:hypothetical protein
VCAFCWAETGKQTVLSYRGPWARPQQGRYTAWVAALAWPAVPGPHALFIAALPPVVPVCFGLHPILVSSE